ncbi:MAG: hypothetical protein J0H17_13875 [Rhizobiales bacterium]|nr:hypothetical protein [Hyphomicrobiales bacterium]
MTKYFVVQPFERSKKGRMVPGAPVQAKDEPHAHRMARRLAETRGGALAFSRTGDLALGDFEDAVVLGTYGQVPDEALQT